MPPNPRVLHAYKVYRPDLDGGIPAVIAMLSKLTRDEFSNSILVARSRGLGRSYQMDRTAVEAVMSWGTIFSTPLAPGYPAAFLKRAACSDIVVHHAPFPLTDMVAPKLAKDIALIVYWHADITSYPLLKKAVTPAILRTLERADKIIVADASMITASVMLSGFSAKCHVVPYGADLQFWSDCSPPEQAAAAHLRQRHPRMILAVGRLVGYKGLASLLRALTLTQGEAIIIGEGPLLGELTDLAKRLGVADRVTFKGRLTSSAIKSHLHAARVFAFPSVSAAEAFGLVQLEAMAAALPIVNTSLPTAVPKIARHDREALTVPPDTPGALAQALNSILNDDRMAMRLGQGGKARALSEYSQSRYALRIAEIYREAMKRATIDSVDLSH